MVEIMDVFKANHKTWNLTFSDSDGFVDITGDTIWFTVKEKDNLDALDSEADIQKEITSHTDPANGESAIILSDTDTDIDPKDYYFDIERETAAGTKKTILKGIFRVKQTVRTP